MSLLTVNEIVPPPVVPGQRSRMADFTGELRRCGYDTHGVSQRLGVHPRLGVNFWTALRPNWTPRSDDAVDTLLEFFIDSHAVAIDRLRTHVSTAFVDALINMRLAEESVGALRSRICLFPCYGKYLVTDRAEKNTAINQVMWLWGESYVLGGLVKRTPRRRAIDLGTGSGVHAILASDHCRQVVAVDINPRALKFARFNAALNGIENIEFVLSDLLNSVDSTCDLLLANPPYAPDSAAVAGANFWSGGVEGTELLQRIVAAIPLRLDADGAAHIIALYPNPAGSTIREHFDRWLGGTLSRYEVLDQTWPVPHYQDELSVQPFAGDKSAWRFGVVSLRLARHGYGWWKETAGRGIFFLRDGSCSAIADHEAP